MSINTFDDKRFLSAFRETLTASLTPVIALKFPYAIEPANVVQTVVGTGAITQEDSMAKVTTGASSSSSALVESKDVIVYQPGQGGLVRFTAIFTEGVAGSIQEVGVGDGTDGYFVGVNGTQFGINRKVGGVDNWTYISHAGDGSDDPIGRLDITKGNIYQIQYQWLGFGQITFWCYDYLSERYEVLERINYPNKNIVPSTFNPSFPLRVYAENTTNDAAITIKTSSMAAFIEGKLTALTNRFAVDNSKTITTEVSILTIRVRETFHGKTTRGIAFPNILSVASDGTKSVTIRAYKDVTLGGTPSYSNVNTNNSIVESDTAGTTVTGGTLVMSFKVGRIDSVTLFLESMVKKHRLETLTITAESANSNDVDVSLSWQELL